MASYSYVRNIQGHRIKLTLVEVDPFDVKLDSSNPRIGFAKRQLTKAELKDAKRIDAAATLVLTSQEDTEGLKRSILLSGGVQEPIYLRADGRVAEGNRRVVALRRAQEEYPDDSRYSTMPAWIIPKGTPEPIIQDLVSEVHLGSVRGWAPYEKGLQMRSLVKQGLIESEVAERYRMSPNEVRQFIAAVDFMEELYFPITDDPNNFEHRSKFSYFLEFCKNRRLQAHVDENPKLPAKFAKWVKEERIDAGVQVRRLPSLLDSAEATRLLEASGFKAAEEYLESVSPKEHELYSLMEQARARLSKMTVKELSDMKGSKERIKILEALESEVQRRLREAGRAKARK